MTTQRLRPALLLSALLLSAVLSLAPAGAAEALPPPWQHQDIGAAPLAGSAETADGVFTLRGTLDIWGTADGCHFAWQTLKGDGTIVARVRSIELTGHSKGGVAIRESLAADSRHATMVDTPTDGTQFLVRAVSGAPTTVQKTGLHKGTLPYWVKLVRGGDRITGFESLDRKEWVQTGTTTLALPESVLIGLVASSHQQDQLGGSALDEVKVTPGRP